VALKEYKPEKLLYTMGEVTEMFDVKPSLIRFWTDRFDILNPKKNKKGNRLFSPEDVKNLEMIYHLTKERGMTLAGVEKYLKNNRKEAERETEIVRRLQTIRALLAEIREELKGGAEGETTFFPERESESPATPKPPVDDFWSDDPPVEEAREEAGTQPTPPDPLEFTEEILAGEITDDNEANLDAIAFEGYSDQEDSFGLNEEKSDPHAWTEETPDEELSVPFLSQPLFELEVEPTEASGNEAAADPEKESALSAIDTQQSLF
jgi:DNA-binding transcriptional MerR regulator